MWSIFYAVSGSTHFAYVEAIRTSKVYARDLTAIPPVILALFSSHFKVYEREGVLVVDGWLMFRSTGNICQALQTLRNSVDDAFLERALNPITEDSPQWLAVLADIAEIAQLCGT